MKVSSRKVSKLCWAPPASGSPGAAIWFAQEALAGCLPWARCWWRVVTRSLCITPAEVSIGEGSTSRRIVCVLLFVLDFQLCVGAAG
eukprot:3061338-Amphidinium_carterae.1